MADEQKVIREKDMDLSFDDDEPEMPPEEERRIIVLEQLGMTLSRSRSEAIMGRTNSGIEDQWLGDEEYYQGIDESNRGETSSWQSKPAGQAGLPQDDDEDTGSSVFINITSTYVDASSARVSDMAIPMDDKSFSIAPTPIPDLIAVAEGNIPEHLNKQIEAGFPGDPAGAQAAKDEAIGQEAKILNEAKEKAYKAEKRIHDWHEDSNFAEQKRLAIQDAAKVGSGILKGPIPQNKSSIAYIDGKMKTQDKIIPVSKRISYWSLFPDPACGDNIHNGSFVWERDDITRKQLLSLKKNGKYLKDQIDRVMKEGPRSAVSDYSAEETLAAFAGTSKRDTRTMFEIWYYYGQITREEFKAAGGTVNEKTPAVIDGHLVMVNNHVIKAVMNHMDTGDFPYDIFPWKKRERMPWGKGIARELRQCQDIINAATRNMMDNAGIAGGPMWIFKEGLVEPQNGVYELAPRKGWIAAEDSDVEDVSKAFSFVKMDIMVDDLQKIIQLALKFAEDVTGMPMILQGQQGKAPDTVGGMQILNNNASTVLRRIARLLDDHITEPHVRRYYKYLLQYGEESNEKGDFIINARGSSALVEREIQSQAILQLGQLALNPVYKIDPAKYSDELLKSQRFDPKKFNYDDDEWQKVVQGLADQGQKQDTKVEQVQIKGEIDTQNKQATMQHESQEKALDRQLELQMKEIDSVLDQTRMENEKAQALDKHKVDMAKLSLQLQVQKEIASKKQVAKSGTEVPGKAANGEGFEK